MDTERRKEESFTFPGTGTEERTDISREDERAYVKEYEDERNVIKMESREQSSGHI